MATNFYFDSYENNLEQTLVEELVIESIQIHGVNFLYMPRRIGNYDLTYNEDASSYYDKAVLIDMYVKNPSSGFGGRGDFMSGLGAEIRDNFTVVVARRTWQAEVGDQETYTRPREGDLIYFPLNKKIFKISFVEHESIFYQVGALQVWELKCELFEYSGELFNTGIPEVDSLGGKYNINIANTGILQESGASVTDELNDLPLELEPSINQGEIDLGAMNDIFQDAGDEIIDFTCVDPFVAPEGTY